MDKCLYCYKELFGKSDYHESCAQKFFGTKNVPIIPYSLSEMEILAKEVVERSISVPGVQPKLSMSVLKAAGNQKETRLTIVGALGGNYIFKPPNPDFKEMPENEHVTMRLAEAFGIKTVPSSLIRLNSGELGYITKRIDRKKDGSKIHMLDMFQITEAYDKYRSSMERVGKAVLAYSANTLLDALSLFELTVFSYLTGNNDMHLKNFSMLKTNIGWVLAPADDLLNVAIVNPDDTEELALTLQGKKKNFSKEHFMTFGEGLGLNQKQISGVFKRFLKKKEEVENLLESSFLSEEMKDKYLQVVFNKCKVFD
jgi:serine/threonine-protein kinase HipA